MVEIPHSRPLLGAEEVAEVQRVVASGMLAQGPEVEAFEQELASALGGGAVSAVAHGTGALHLSLLALGAGPGKNVILPSYSCVSLLNSIVYTGATPIAVDCVEDAPDVDLEQVASHLSPDTVALVVPHLFGRVVDLRSIASHVPVLEDATHAVGASRAGSVGKACVYSFYATKMLAGGEGGAVTSRLGRVHQVVRDRRSYDYRTDWIPRFNYKMTDVSAALLRVQLRRLPTFLARRRELAVFYRAGLRGLDGVLLPAAQSGEVHYRFVLRIRRRSREKVELALRELGIGVARPVWRTIHHCLKQPARDFPRSQRWWREALSIPLYPALSDAQAERVVDGLRRVLA
jgi:perosamine synthetase